MLLYIVLDLCRDEWRMAVEDPLNNLQVFINALLLSTPSAVVRVVNSRTVVFDSQLHPSFSTVLTHPSRCGVDPGDLGYALIAMPTAVVVFEMSRPRSTDYLGYLKCMSYAHTRGIPVHAFSLHKSMLLKMCSEGTGGMFLESPSLSSLFQLLGNFTNTRGAYSMSCLCCSKSVSVGFVCPVCLSVFCKFIPVCKKCKTKFSFVK